MNLNFLSIVLVYLSTPLWTVMSLLSFETISFDGNSTEPLDSLCVST